MFIVTADEMRELDRETIQGVGIPGPVLMENAGRGAVCVLRRVFPDLQRRRVAVLCGRGNNGGDGFVIARCLLHQGVSADVFLMGTPGQVTGDARIPLGVLGNLGITLREIGTPQGTAPSEVCFVAYNLIVDALLGTGLNAEVRGGFQEVIEAVNRSRVPVMAVDIPSGLSSDHGRPLGTAVEATATVTFGLPKLGHFLHPGRRLCGELWVVDIGIPPQVTEKRGLSRRVVTPRSLRGMLPPRFPDAHKGRFGHALVLAGSAGKTGAGVMASEAALRVGAGLVTLGVPRSLNLAMEARLTEVMTLPLAETDGQSFSRSALPEIHSALEGKTCMALGPGLSTHAETQELVRALAREVGLPMVIDADGLNALAGHPDALGGAKAARILTPHPGEMGRLLGRSVREIQEDRLAAAQELSRRSGAFVVLKGAGTVLAAPDGGIRLVPTGNPAMASAGMGDVLTGILIGLLAQGMEPLEAMSLGTYLHGWIADQWAEEMGARGLLATDLLARIPKSLDALSRGDVPRSWPRSAEGCAFHA